MRKKTARTQAIDHQRGSRYESVVTEVVEVVAVVIVIVVVVVVVAVVAVVAVVVVLVIAVIVVVAALVIEVEVVVVVIVIVIVVTAVVVVVVVGLFESTVLLQVHQPPAVLYFGPVFNGRLWASRPAQALTSRGNFVVLGWSDDGGGWHCPLLWRACPGEQQGQNWMKQDTDFLKNVILSPLAKFHRYRGFHEFSWVFG